MKVVCVGAGPAGLYLSILLKLRSSDCEISVFERNAAGAAEGWGIISVGNSLIRQLRAHDPVSASTILTHSTKWTGQALRVQGRTTAYRKSFGYSIGRKRFLEILSARAAELGIELYFQTEITRLDQFDAADLIVASDGAGSMIREAGRDVFGAKIQLGRSKYIWLGTSKVFETFTFAIEKTDAGWIWFHGYPHAKDMSTCVVECSPATWSGLGFDRMDTDSSIHALDGIFAGALDGRNLLGGGSTWRNFRTITNRTWHQGNVVLSGDAAHTAHFSLGSGTRLAIEDAISLSRNLLSQESIEQAIANYETERMPEVRAFQRNAGFSAAWFENIERYLDLPDREILALLLNRRSPIVARMPPRLYYWLNVIAKNVPFFKYIKAAVLPKPRVGKNAL